MKCINPFTKQEIGVVDPCDTASIPRLVSKAKLAGAWSARQTIGVRVSWIKSFRELFSEKRSSLAKVLSIETGKPISQAISEVAATLSRIDYFIETVPKVLDKKIVRKDGNTVEELSYEPLGVIANISAWNYPYFIGTNVFIPALLAGNAVLYKPSELAALVGAEIASMFYESGLPENLFITLQGAGDVGSVLASAKVDGLFFTGSNKTGLEIARAAAEKLIPCVLELGGKDPCYITANAGDIKQTAQSVADGVFYNAGQSCCSVERLYVHKDVYEEFVACFLDEVRNYRIGDPLDSDTYIGPMTRSEQLELLEFQVRDAVSKGAQLLLGGDMVAFPSGFFPPTVLADVNHNMVVMREESFGPIIGIHKVSSDEEAVHLMNDTSFGLTAAVYTDSFDQGRDILAEVPAGSVYVNCCDRVSPFLPWSGRQGSGLGSTLGHRGIYSLVHPKSWHIRTVE